LHEALLTTLQKIAGTRRSYEVDPTRIDNMDKVTTAKRSLQRLNKRLRNVFQSLDQKIELCPAIIRSLAFLVPAAQRNQVVSIVFLRFICPAIVNPSVIGMDAKITQFGQRGLIILARVLQFLANSTGELAGPLADICAIFAPMMNNLLEKFHRPFSLSPTAGTSLSPNLIPRQRKLQSMDVIVKYTNEKVQKLEVLLGHTNTVAEHVAAALNKVRGDEEESCRTSTAASLCRILSSPDILSDVQRTANHEDLGTSGRKLCNRELRKSFSMSALNAGQTLLGMVTISPLLHAWERRLPNKHLGQ